MKHLTYDDRLSIQKGLKYGRSFTQIADEIGKDRSTVSREVRRHRHFVPYDTGNICVHRKTCQIYDRCTSRRPDCRHLSRCRNRCGLCNQDCMEFQPETCLLTQRPPYVCNGCSKRCNLGKWQYDAKQAQAAAESTLRDSRTGISLSDTEFQFLQDHIVPLIQNGLSVAVACQAYQDQMPVCAKTMYAYIQQGLFKIDHLDLRLKVRRPLRKKSGPVRKVDQHCHEGRTYADYLAYMQAHPRAVVCQMDTVEGKKGGKVILTLYFQSCGLQLMYLRDRNDAASVSSIFYRLRKELGEDFDALFQVILTDRGTEFSNPQAIENNPKTGVRDCRVFYCDPRKVNQKSECERNHELVRYIFPKGHALDRFHQRDVTRAMNHINSFPRPKWGSKSPLNLFKEQFGPHVAQKLNLDEIELSSIRLRPDLVK